MRVIDLRNTRGERPRVDDKLHTLPRRLHGRIGHRFAQAEVVDDDVHNFDAIACSVRLLRVLSRAPAQPTIRGRTRLAVPPPSLLTRHPRHKNPPHGRQATRAVRRHSGTPAHASAGVRADALRGPARERQREDADKIDNHHEECDGYSGEVTRAIPGGTEGEEPSDQR